MFISHEIAIGAEIKIGDLGKNTTVHYLTQNVADEVEAKIVAEDYLESTLSKNESLVLDAPYQVDRKTQDGKSYWSVTLWVDTPGTCPLYN